MKTRNTIPYRLTAEYRAARETARKQVNEQRRAARVGTLQNVGGAYAPLFRV